MDAGEFTKRLKVALGRRLGSYGIQVLKDNLPLSVDFLVISTDFDGVSRGARIQLLADSVKEAFSLPLTFRPVGLAMTPDEHKALQNKDFEAEEGDSVISKGNKNVASSAFEETP